MGDLALSLTVYAERHPIPRHPCRSLQELQAPLAWGSFLWRSSNFQRDVEPRGAMLEVSFWYKADIAYSG
jgi:hypothetical protein